jgi:hypothetical protein
VNASKMTARLVQNEGMFFRFAPESRKIVNISA